MGRLVVGALAAGIVVFMWGAISHMATPIGKMGFRSFPNEETIVAAMKGSIHETGIYLFPDMPDSQTPTESETSAWEARYKQGPTGFLVYHTDGGEAMSPRQLLTELGSSVFAGLLAAGVLSQVKSGYLGRVLIVTLMGMFGFVSINISYWNWYRFPIDFTTGAVLDEIIGWFLGGLVLAAIVKPLKITKPTSDPAV